MISLIPIFQAEAASNPNLFVSAENSKFDNTFSGSMVIEVVVRDSNLRNTDQGKGEPDVTINGKVLRMVQATDGNWYAYFANVNKAKIADSTVGLAGEGLDFGVFCSRNTPASVFGISLSETDGFSVPHSSGLTSFTDGNSSFSQCAGNLTNSQNLNNVVRKAKSINTNPNVLSGQIGLDPNAWPLIQLYSFNNVVIEYNPGGNTQRVNLEYDASQNITMAIDRDLYPQNSEVFLTINDFQLNQDPTDEDSWTFNVNSPHSTFYQAFDNNGSNAANGDVGLVNLVPFLSSLGFEDNGKLILNLGNIMELKSNDEQPFISVTDKTQTFSQIVTLVEKGPNSGIFDNGDDNDDSVIKISSDASRGTTGRIEYNKDSISVLTGPSSASVSINKPKLTVDTGTKSLTPGTEFSVTLFDPDQNINSGSRDNLDVFRDSSVIPSMQIGSPVTLESSSGVQFFSLSTDALNTGISANSSVPDKNSDILIIDTSGMANTSFEKISFNLGSSVSALKSVLIDSSTPNTRGTNWINYDFRSFEKNLGLRDFSDTTITLSFGTLGSSPVTIVDSGDLSSAKGFFQISDSDVQAISSKSGTVYVEVNFDSSNNSSSVGIISNKLIKHPIVFDIFSFGIDDNKSVNNSIYRFELRETSDNSSEFVGSIEYAVANQLNILDPSFIRTTQTINDEIKFIVTDRLIDEKGVSISYSDLDKVGVVITTTKSDAPTNLGVVSTNSQSYRFGQPVTVTLNDPDLNLKSDAIDVYLVVDNPNSPNVDTVGKDGSTLLEILIKDIRYKRCTVNGVEHGGLGATGFTLVETGPSTGIFTGVFKMPSQICDKSGTKLISSAGGSLDVKYFDSSDEFGNPNTFSLLKNKTPMNSQYTSMNTKPMLSSTEILKPSPGNTEEIIMSGNIANHKRGIPLTVTLTGPDGSLQNFGATLTSSGRYKTAFSINENSLPGLYKIQLSHAGMDIGLTSFTVSSPSVPDWVKTNTKLWSTSKISDSKFIDSIKHLIEQGIIVHPSEQNPISGGTIPDWVKTNAKWWSNGQISEEDFLKSVQYLIKKSIIPVQPHN